MYSFFYYTPVVNYGTEVDNAATVDYHIGVDDGVWKDDSAWFDGRGWRNVGCWVYKRDELSTTLLDPVYPLHPECVVAKGGDELYIIREIICERGKWMLLIFVI